MQHRICLLTTLRFFCHSLAAPIILFGFISAAQAEQPLAKAAETSAWNLFEPAQDIQLGEELDEWLMMYVEPVESDRLNDYIDAIGDRLGRRGLALPLSITLLAEPEPHAFAFPGGRVYVTTGIFALMEDETRFAALLAHEIAHSELRHATQALSRAKRLTVPAALAATATGRLDLLEALSGIGLDPRPGAPWTDYRAVDEATAIAHSAKLLARAGYDPATAADLLPKLHAGSPAGAHRYVSEHPLPEHEPAYPLAETPWKREKHLASKRAFRNLRTQAKSASSKETGLHAVYAWTPPVAPEPRLEPRELFITSSYVFSYPSEWIPSKAGPNETIQVAPKGERQGAVSSASGIRVGVIAGTLPWDPVHDDARDLLFEHIERIRPGLHPGAPPVGPQVSSDKMQSLFLRGEGDTGSKELVWLVTRGLSERLFYLLMVAPEETFPEYRAEFERIFQSIDFLGHPLSGQAGAKGQDGNN